MKISKVRFKIPHDHRRKPWKLLVFSHKPLSKNCLSEQSLHSTSPSESNSQISTKQPICKEGTCVLLVLVPRQSSVHSPAFLIKNAKEQLFD